MIYQAARGARIAAKYLGLGAIYAWLTGESEAEIHKTLTIHRRPLELNAASRSQTLSTHRRPLTLTVPED